MLSSIPNDDAENNISNSPSFAEIYPNNANTTDTTIISLSISSNNDNAPQNQNMVTSGVVTKSTYEIFKPNLKYALNCEFVGERTPICFSQTKTNKN